MTISTRNILPNFETFRCPRSFACNIFHLPNFFAFILLTYRFDNILELLIRRRRDGRGKKMKRKKNYNRNLTVRFNPPPPTLPSPKKEKKKRIREIFFVIFLFFLGLLKIYACFVISRVFSRCWRSGHS